MSVQAIVVEEIVHLLDGERPIPQLGERTELSECGLDSVSYLKLLLRLEERCGKDVLGRDADLPVTVGDLIETFEDTTVGEQNSIPRRRLVSSSWRDR
jgi:acyl carrier protein